MGGVHTIHIDKYGCSRGGAPAWSLAPTSPAQLGVGPAPMGLLRGWAARPSARRRLSEACCIRVAHTADDPGRSGTSRTTRPLVPVQQTHPADPAGRAPTHVNCRESCGGSTPSRPTNPRFRDQRVRLNAPLGASQLRSSADRVLQSCCIGRPPVESDQPARGCLASAGPPALRAAPWSGRAEFLTIAVGIDFVGRPRLARTPNFFTETFRLQSQQTELFDFVWSTAAALWNLRWQVQGFLQVVPSATSRDLNSRFLHGSGILSANFHRTCVQRDWSANQEQFARYVLFVSLAIYEAWTGDLAQRFNPMPKGRPLDERMQFPTDGIKYTRVAYDKGGIGDAISHMRASASEFVKEQFSSRLDLLPTYAPDDLDAMLLCYRYFKDLRNTILHRGGVANSYHCDVWTDFAALSPDQLGMDDLPRHQAPSVSQLVRVDLHGVVGFSGVIRRLVATVEGLVAPTEPGEQAFLERWRAETRLSQLPKPGQKRDGWIVHEAARIGLPEPARPDLLAEYLIDSGVVSKTPLPH
jgi:hypothetical protein